MMMNLMVIRDCVRCVNFEEYTTLFIFMPNFSQYLNMYLNYRICIQKNRYATIKISSIQALVLLAVYCADSGSSFCFLGISEWNAC